MKRSIMVQYFGIMIAFASIFLPSLDMTRVGMLVGLVIFLIGFGMGWSKNDKSK